MPSVSLGYVLSQLSAASSARVSQWRSVLEGMLSGLLDIGARTPVQGAPPWVTLDVVHGGFATGGFAAGGALLPHEHELLAKLGHPARERASLNQHYLVECWPELLERLESGRYRVQVPEEAALLASAWLLRRGEADAAEALVRELVPFFSQLRFYPAPHPRPLRLAAGVSVEPAGETRQRLSKRQPQPHVARMNEAITVWAPLYDRTVALWLETVEEGWPCRRYPADFRERAQGILSDYERLRARHHLCGKPEKRKEGFARLRGYLARAASDPTSLSGRDVGSVRQLLDRFVAARGAPGSDRHGELRRAQQREAERPLHHRVARTLAERLAQEPEDEGVPEVERVVGPLSADEAVAAGTVPGALVPAVLVQRARRCWEAPLGALVAEDVVASSEAMARLLPPLTAQARSASIQDEALRRLYWSSYRAFRQRRSLLLVNLESQVRLDELPWLRALGPWTGGSEASAAACGAVLCDVARLALGTFPYTLLPNKLVKELRALASGAGTPLPFVEELAADIFMGAFGEQYLRAAQTAAALLAGSIYERYYDVPFAALAALDDVKKEPHSPPTSAGFAALCSARAVKPEGGSGNYVAQNGTVIEQAQIFTTHNLAALFALQGVREALTPALPELARECYSFVCRRQQVKKTAWQVRLRMQKNTAYAWRQMLFFLSLMPQDAVEDFLQWSEAFLMRQSTEFRERFAPAQLGLRLVVAGERFDGEGRYESGARRFLGWSLGRHWLMGRE